MKKILIIMALLMLTCGVFADSLSDDDGITYDNYLIYKTYAHPDAYVVMYYTKGVDLGQVTIPAEWFKPSVDRKGTLRLIDRKIFTPYLIVQKKDDTVTQVILTMPSDRGDASWGVMAAGIDVLAKEGKGNTLYLD